MTICFACRCTVHSECEYTVCECSICKEDNF